MSGSRTSAASTSLRSRSTMCCSCGARTSAATSSPGAFRCIEEERTSDPDPQRTSANAIVDGDCPGLRRRQLRVRGNDERDEILPVTILVSCGARCALLFGFAIRPSTKSRNSSVSRSKARACQRRPLWAIAWGSMIRCSGCGRDIDW